MINDKAKLITCLVTTLIVTISGVRLTQAQEEESEAPKASAPAATPTASGPIDITADEQEFATDSVIAKGAVRVVYKDSVITAPLATLYKDESGNPNRAVFTGHPRLTQAHSKIDANMLTMELQKQKILAVGGAHSEVDIPDDEKDNGLTSAKKDDKKPVPVVAPKSADSDEEDGENTAVATTQAPSDSKAKADKPPEKIITDSDRQEFDQGTGRFDCFGNVKVINGDMIIHAEKMQVIYGATSNKPETCLFTGHVIASQGKNTTYADNINYSLSTKRLQASGNVKSKVIQEKKEEAKPTAKADIFGAPAAAANTKQLKGNASATSIAMPMNSDNDKPFWIFSDAQDYNRDGGRMAAQGNVKVVNGDMYGCGPSVVMTKRPDGKADKVYFVGRSQITQPGRRWIADEITYTVDTKMVIANGNARAMVMQNPADKKPSHKIIQTDEPQGKPDDKTGVAGNKQIISTHSSPSGESKKEAISATKEALPK
jgi:lipopolysaccharide export system protein LptA